MLDASPATLAAETARYLKEAGRRPEAARWFRRALEIDPAHGSAAAGLIRMHLEDRAPAEAVEVLLSRPADAPEDLTLLAARRDLALALYISNLWEIAAPWLARAAELEPWDLALAEAARRTRVPDFLAPQIADPLSGRRLERTAARESDTYIFVIDIVGTCNLRCPTCPVGNSDLDGRPIGFMEPSLFERIVEKIEQESPVSNPQINLYNWGEPLLHPELPRFIKLLNSKGMRACLSSNLNIKRGLEEVIAADPSELKISLSGFTDETYRRAHLRGKVELVKSNMRRIADLRRKHTVRTRIWVGHHIYKSNRHEIDAVRRFCQELGFEHHPMEAFYMPLERLIDVIEDRGNPRDGGIVEDLVTHPKERLMRGAALRKGRYDCELRFNQTVINHDGSVALCCTVYDPSNMLGVQFLDEPLEAINERKYRHPFCGKCYGMRLEYAPAELPLLGDLARSGHAS